MQYIIAPNCRLCNHPMETIEHLLHDCAGIQSYHMNHDPSFDTLVLEKPRDIIRIAYFNTWLRDVFSFSTRPPTYRIVATVKEMTSNENRKKNRE